MLLGLTLILILGVSAQWLAWRTRLPSILLLLLFGFLAGPVALWVTNPELLQRFIPAGYVPDHPIYLNPAELLGESLLLTLVSLAVGVILFEGGLTLNLREIHGVRKVVRNMVTVGALVTWVIASLAAWWLLELTPAISILLGAVLIVTGPTVIGPLLRHVRPTGAVGSVLKWEGIVIDPIGALAAVLVFEAILAGLNFTSGNAAGTAWAFGKGALLTSVTGTVVGAASAWVLILCLKRYWIPDHLQIPITLALVGLAFAGSDAIYHESGLFATTVMGIVLANQKQVHIRHIIDFKEVLTVLLIATLFIVLSSRLELAYFKLVTWRSMMFLAVLIFIARPLAVWASTLGSKLTIADRIFLCWMAPRGIVAASVASVFSLRLAEELPGTVVGDQAALLVPYTFMVIIATVAVYGLTTAGLATRLKLAKPGQAGFLIAGAGPLARAIGKQLNDDGYDVLLVDTNFANAQAARLAGLPTLTANILSGQVSERIALSGIGRLLAITPNDQINALAVLQYIKLFGRTHCFQLARNESSRKTADTDRDLQGRVLFSKDHTYSEVMSRLNAGAVVKKTKITKEFSFEQFKSRHPDGFAPLWIINETGGLILCTDDKPPILKAGQTIVTLVVSKQDAPKPETVTAPA